MPRTVGIIAAPADADAVETLVRELASARCTCVLDPASIDLAPATIIVCSSRAVPSTVMAGLVERAFSRKARLLPVLIDLQSPPRELSHFLAGLRCLECARGDLASASALLRKAIERLPEDQPAAQVLQEPLNRRVPAAPAIHLNTWSAVVRVGAVLGVMLAVWRLPGDAVAVRTVPDGDSFSTWARSVNHMTYLYGLAAMVVGIGFLGWLRAAFRNLVLAHRERQMKSWLSLWGGYALALVYPPLAIGVICRVWAALAGGATQPLTRVVVVSVWWVALLISSVAPTVAWISIGGTAPDLPAVAAAPPDAATQRRFVAYMSLANAASLIMFGLTIVIARRDRRRRAQRTLDVGTQSRAALMLASPADRPIADVLATRLHRHGIDLYVPASNSPPDLAAYDVIVLLGRARHALEAVDLAVVDRAVEAGEPPVLPLSWRSPVPPASLQARLGPSHWYTASLEDESVHTLATALLKSPRRAEAIPASAIRLGVSRGPRLALARGAVAVFALGAAWSIASLGRSFADFDFLGLLIVATRSDATSIWDPFALGQLFLRELAWRAESLLPAVAAAAGLFWVMSRQDVHATAVGLRPAGGVLFDTREYPHRVAEMLAVGLAIAFATPWFNTPVLLLFASTAVTLAVTAVLFVMMGAARRRLRAIVQYWDAEPAATGAPSAPARSWLVPLILTTLMGAITFMALGMFLGFSMAVQANANPSVSPATATAMEQTEGIVVAEILFVHLPAAAIWWWWLGHGIREMRAAGRAPTTRARRALALVPLAGHVDIPEIVRESTAQRYAPTSVTAVAVRTLATSAALGWTLSLLWLAAATWAADAQAMSRTIMTSTLAFILFALAATLLWWLIGLVPSDRSRNSSARPEAVA
jgi:hypothetical protein